MALQGPGPRGPCGSMEQGNGPASLGAQHRVPLGPGLFFFADLTPRDLRPQELFNLNAPDGLISNSVPTLPAH